ncbi:hypothetical protein OJ998_10515 [Solirubrobacter taibaiensis]|nr:hypothetical protein [Solirubrobacter taibaiensis]
MLLPSCDSTSALSGELLLDAVTDAILALYWQKHGHLPATAETTMLGDDLLTCTIGGTYADTDNPSHTADVRHAPETVQPSRHHDYVDVVERLSGRTVLAFIADFDAGPDLRIELFWLAPLPVGGSGPPGYIVARVPPESITCSRHVP